MQIVVPTIEEMIVIGELLGGGLINQHALESLVIRIKSECRQVKHDIRHQVAKASAIIWTDVVRNEPFISENRATATELMLYFLRKNNFSLQLTESETKNSGCWLQSDSGYEELVRWIYERLREQVS